MSLIAVRREDAIAWVTLDRADKLNALNEVLLQELLNNVLALERDHSVRAAVLTGAGDRAFAAGVDIASMVEMTALQARELSELGRLVGAALEQSRIPFIAAVNGFALGGGSELAMCCDVIYASDRAKLGQPEVNLGVIPGFGGTQRLARRVGVGRARELCMTGEIVDAAEALRLGWVDAVVPHSELFERVGRLAATMSAKAPLAIAAIKRLIRTGDDMSLSAALAVEAASFASLFGTEDQREGMRAFLEKRPPTFVGK